MNKTILTGRFTRDPELRYTPKGTAVVQFGLANNRKWTTEGGEKREDVLFLDVKAFGKPAETIQEYFKKGDPILVEGRLKLEEWEDKQTQAKRSKIVLLAEHFDFFAKAQDGGTAAAPRTAPAARPPDAVPLGDDGPPNEHDDVPF